MPGSTDILTCGRFQLDLLDGGTGVGRFVYGRRYLARVDAVPLDPFSLPLLPTEFQTIKLGGLFGCLRDVAPDHWGRRIIDRRRGAEDLTEFDYLVSPSRGRIGALSFGETPEPEPLPSAEIPGLHDLKELREAAARVEEDLPVDVEVEDLLAAGSSVGGARPKTVVQDQHGIWLAKFPQRGDRWSNAPVEAAMLHLAAACGIRVPEVRVEALGDEQILLVSRFDREMSEQGELRHRMVSALTVLDLDDAVVDRAGWSYLAFADELQRWSAQPLEDKRELFRRVVFNALISNSDDHPRNHALIAPGRGWRLSPAYDLTPSTARSLERRDLAMIAGDHGRWANRKNLLSSAPRFGFTPEDANAQIDQAKAIVEDTWCPEILRVGGSEADCDAVRGAFAYPGFEL
ncbi:MAG: HipA domain-containing protein [Gemmatimonadetes bacterium]|nr:HipA domain-containing protein [Gemmatimonadota bacterium]